MDVDLYYKNGNIRCRKVIGKDDTFKYSYMYYSEDGVLTHCDIVKHIDNSGDVYQTSIIYYNSGNIKQIERKKNGLLHNNNNEITRIIYYESGNIRNIAWYTDGSLTNFNKELPNMYDNENRIDWWNYNPMIIKASNIEYNENNIVTRETFENNVYFMTMDYYGNGNIKYITKINKTLDAIYTELYDINNYLVSKTWTLYNEYHNYGDYPAYIYYYPLSDNKIKECEWWKYGIQIRDDNKPVCIEYYESGQMKKEIWDVCKIHDSPTFIEYYESGKLKSKNWMCNKLYHRDNDLPAIIQYYDNDNNTIKYEEWRIHNRLYRDNYLYTYIKYNQDDSVKRVGWVIENSDSHILDIIHSYNFSDVLLSLDLNYIHNSIGCPRFGYINYVKSKLNKCTFEKYKDEIYQYANNLLKTQYAIYNLCFLEILYLPPKTNFVGGQEYFNVMEDFTKFSLNTMKNL